MPLINRRKPRASRDDVEAEESPAPRRRRRRDEPPSEEELDEEADEEVEELSSAEEGGRDEEINGEDENMDFLQSVKRLVRLALACEVRRQVIRRPDILAKVIKPGSRSFKKVFAAAQKELKQTFGMEMEELPLKEQITIAQKRKAQARDKVMTSSGVWILVTTLPPAFRMPAILYPSATPTPHEEASYTGLYTFMIAVIALSGGCISEGRMTRYLQQVSAGEIGERDGATDKLIQRMVKERYIVRERDATAQQGGEERFDFYIGPRGKVEVSKESVAQIVTMLFKPEGESDVEDLERRIAKSLGIEKANARETDEGENAEEEVDGEEQRRRRSKRGRPADDDE